MLLYTVEVSDVYFNYDDNIIIKNQGYLLIKLKNLQICYIKMY